MAQQNENDETGNEQLIVRGELALGGRRYRDGDFFEILPEDAPELIAGLRKAGSLVTSVEYAQQEIAWSIGGSHDVAAVLQRLRGERDGFQAAADNYQDPDDALKMLSASGGEYNAEAILRRITAERGGYLEAVARLQARIEEIEQAGHSPAD